MLGLGVGLHAYVYAELMLLGFISLFLTVFQPKIASLCMPEKLNRIMLPCPYISPHGATEAAGEAAASPAPAAAHRRLLITEHEEPSSASGSCPAVINSACPS